MKRFSTAVALASLVFALGACSGDDEPATTASDATAAADAAPADTAADAADAGDTGDSDGASDETVAAGGASSGGTPSREEVTTQLMTMLGGQDALDADCVREVIDGLSDDEFQALVTGSADPTSEASAAIIQQMIPCVTAGG